MRTRKSQLIKKRTHATHITTSGKQMYNYYHQNCHIKFDWIIETNVYVKILFINAILFHVPHIAWQIYMRYAFINYYCRIVVMGTRTFLFCAIEEKNEMNVYPLPSAYSEIFHASCFHYILLHLLLVTYQPIFRVVLLNKW